MGFNPIKSIKESQQDAVMELFGNNRIVVTDCNCVLDFSDDCIVLDLGNINVKIKGDSLMLSSFGYGLTDISGDIVSIEFERV